MKCNCQRILIGVCGILVLTLGVVDLCSNEKETVYKEIKETVESIIGIGWLIYAALCDNTEERLAELERRVNVLDPQPEQEINDWDLPEPFVLHSHF